MLDWVGPIVIVVVIVLAQWFQYRKGWKKGHTCGYADGYSDGQAADRRK